MNHICIIYFKLGSISHSYTHVFPMIFCYVPMKNPMDFSGLPFCGNGWEKQRRFRIDRDGSGDITIEDFLGFLKEAMTAGDQGGFMIMLYDMIWF